MTTTRRHVLAVITSGAAALGALFAPRRPGAGPRSAGASPPAPLFRSDWLLLNRAQALAEIDGARALHQSRPASETAACVGRAVALYEALAPDEAREWRRWCAWTPDGRSRPGEPGMGVSRPGSREAMALDLADLEFRLLDERGCSMVLEPAGAPSPSVPAPGYARAIVANMRGSGGRLRRASSYAVRWVPPSIRLA